jgi:hypothetical protein
MDTKTLQLESRFSLPPNSLGYCGKDTAPEKFKKCIIHGECQGVEEEVKKFIVLYPYLKTIAKITSRPIFSYQVIESYWLGNDLLKNPKKKDYNLLLNNFLSQGVPDFFVEELRLKNPKSFIPNHLFHVLHIGVGKASGAVPFNLDSINNCMIRWGKVLELQKNKARVKLNSLKIEKQKYSLVSKEQLIPLGSDLVPGIKTGDIIATHWNMVIKILTEDEAKNLKYWTNQVLEAVS